MLNKVDSLQSFVEKMQNILSLITEVKVTLNNLKTEIEKIQEKRRSADIATMELGVASAACSIGKISYNMCFPTQVHQLVF